MQVGLPGGISLGSCGDRSEVLTECSICKEDDRLADLETTCVDGVLWVLLNRPQRKNAVPVPMWEALRLAFERADQDPEIRAVVLHGAGGNFCAGADLGGMEAPPGPELMPVSATEEDQNIQLMRERIAPAAIALHRVRKPTLAMVEGVAVGAGCNLALGCDVVYAAEDARFSQIFVHRGLSLDFGGSWILPRLVGIQKARELALFGDQIRAPEAAALGMVAGVQPPQNLESFVRERAKQLTQLSPLALATIKQVLHESESLSFADAVDREFVLQGRCITSDFFNKRVYRKS